MTWCRSSRIHADGFKKGFFFAAIVSVAALGSGCLHTTAAEGVSTASLKESETRLVLINNANAGAEYKAGRDSIPNWELDEKKIFISCGLDPNAELAPLAAGALATLAGYAIGAAVDFLVKTTEEALKKQLEKYTGLYNGSSDFDFYDPWQSQAQNQPIPQFNCFRLTRKSSETNVAFDFIASIKVKNQEYLEIAPLRLFVREPVARSTKSSGKKTFGLTVKASADAIWRQENQGKSANKIIDHTILTESFNLPAEGGDDFFYKSYLGDKQKAVSAALVPWSMYGDKAFGGNLTRMTVSVAEAGDAPWMLEKGLKLFEGVKDDISKQIKDAANAAIKKKLE